MLGAGRDHAVAVDPGVSGPLVPVGERPVVEVLERAPREHLHREVPVADDGQSLVVHAELVVHRATVDEADRHEAVEQHRVAEGRRRQIGLEQFAPEFDIVAAVDALPDDLDARDDSAALEVSLAIEVGRGTLEELGVPRIVVVVQHEVGRRRQRDTRVRARPAPVRGLSMQYAYLVAVLFRHARDHLVDAGRVAAVIDDDALPVGHRLPRDAAQRPIEEPRTVLRADDDRDAGVRHRPIPV